MTELQAAELRMFQRIAEMGYLPPLPGKERKPRLADYYDQETRLRMAYVPVIVANTIWLYIDRVLAYCAAHRIDEVKKLSRAVKMVKEDYYNYLRRSVDTAHLEGARNCTDEFMSRFGFDLQIMWHTINNELKKNYAGLEHDEMRTDALCAILLVRLLKSFCRDVDKDLEKKTGISATTINPKIERLDEIMDGYVGDYEIGRPELIQRCEKILRKAIDTIEYRE